MDRRSKGTESPIRKDGTGVGAPRKVGKHGDGGESLSVRREGREGCSWGEVTQRPFPPSNVDMGRPLAPLTSLQTVTRTKVSAGCPSPRGRGPTESGR